MYCSVYLYKKPSLCPKKREIDTCEIMANNLWLITSELRIGEIYHVRMFLEIS